MNTLSQLGIQQILSYAIVNFANPILTQIWKSFTTKTTWGIDQNEYDKNTKKGWVCIEIAFGILKNRWFILKNMNAGVQYAPLIMVVCCILRNFSRIKNETRVVKGEELEDVTLNDINLNKLRQLIYE